MESIVDRINYFIKIKGLNKRRFCLETGLSNGFLDKVKSIGSDKIESIIETYPELDLTWLVTGRGNPTSDIDTETSVFEVNEPPPVYGLSPKVISVDPSNNENICLVDVKAAAGYTQNVSSEEYVRELPVFNIPIPNFQHGSFRAFQVDGDSMEPTLFSNDWVIARSIESFEQIREGYVHVLVARSGIIVKRLLNRAKVRQKIVAQSDNNSYSTYEVELDDILEIWAVSAKLSTNLSNVSRDIRDQINDLTIEMMDVKNRLNNIENKPK